MDVRRRGYADPMLSRRGYAEPLSERMEIVTEIGDDIRIYVDDSAARMLQNRVWGG